jgi:hypothetical protein
MQWYLNPQAMVQFHPLIKVCAKYLQAKDKSAEPEGHAAVMVFA